MDASCRSTELEMLKTLVVFDDGATAISVKTAEMEEG